MCTPARKACRSSSLIRKSIARRVPTVRKPTRQRRGVVRPEMTTSVLGPADLSIREIEVLGPFATVTGVLPGATDREAVTGDARDEPLREVQRCEVRLVTQQRPRPAIQRHLVDADAVVGVEVVLGVRLAIRVDRDDEDRVREVRVRDRGTCKEVLTVEHPFNRRPAFARVVVVGDDRPLSNKRIEPVESRATVDIDFHRVLLGLGSRRRRGVVAPRSFPSRHARYRESKSALYWPLTGERTYSVSGERPRQDS